MMTVNEAIKILLRQYECVETDACDFDCDHCQMSGDKEMILDALSMAVDALKGRNTLCDLYDGDFGGRQCDNCCVGYPSHYERKEDGIYYCDKG